MPSAATVTRPIAEYEQLKRDAAAVRIVREDCATILRMALVDFSTKFPGTPTPEGITWISKWLTYYMRCLQANRVPVDLEEWIVGNE